MARSGINKVLVMQARQALLARGEHPSIDAVRIELGNTGSKTTIHRYLKELEESEAGRAKSGVGLSEELSQLVAALAERLQGEANELVERMRECFNEERIQLQEQLRLMEEGRRQLEGQVTALSGQLRGEKELHQEAREHLQQLQVEQARLFQANQDQAARLMERDEQIRSLEEKHRHSREALEHYRQASKEQREQEQRRHETQLQQLQMELRQLQQSLMVKQDELTRLNRDNERLTTENRLIVKERDNLQDSIAAQKGELDTLCTKLNQAYGSRDILLERLALQQSEMAELKASLTSEQGRAQDLQISLVEATTKLNLLLLQATESVAMEEAKSAPNLIKE